MATTALIAYQNNDDQIIAASVSSDGYMEYTGQNLHDYYNSYHLAEQLIISGDLYQVTPSITDIRRFKSRILSNNIYDSYDDFMKDRRPWTSKPDVFLNGHLHVYLFMEDAWFYYKEGTLYLLSEFIKPKKQSWLSKIVSWFYNDHI